MEKGTAGEVIGGDWQTVDKAERTADHWRHALHMPDGYVPSSGRGVVVMVCGFGHHPDPGDTPNVNRLLAVSDECLVRGGVRCDGQLWRELVGLDNGELLDYAGIAPAATYLTGPCLTEPYASNHGGKLAEHILTTLAGRVDVLVLPPVNGGDTARWTGAIRAAHTAGALIVGDAGWRYDMPEDVRLFAPLPWVVDGDTLRAVRIVNPGGRMTSVNTVCSDTREPWAKRQAVAVAAGMVASAVGCVLGGRVDPRFREVAVRDVLHAVYGGRAMVAGYKVPSHSDYWPIVRRPDLLTTSDGQTGVTELVSETGTVPWGPAVRAADLAS